MIGYRVSSKKYEVGDELFPCGKSYVNDNDSRKAVKVKVAELLESKRPCLKPNRETILMIFTTIEDAKRFKKESCTSDSKIYEVDYDETKVLHTGCLQKVEDIFTLLNSDAITSEIQAKALKIADEYWSEKEIEIPEIFLKNAKTISLVDDAKKTIKEASKEKLGYIFKRDSD